MKTNELKRMDQGRMYTVYTKDQTYHGIDKGLVCPTSNQDDDRLWLYTGSKTESIPVKDIISIKKAEYR